MKKDPSSLLKQLQDKLAWVKISIENKFTLEAERSLLRNSLSMLIDKINEEKSKISRQKSYTAKEKKSTL